jgi:hypothetical protein
MTEREDRPRPPRGAPDAPRETLPPAQDQDGSLKVHGDKLERMIPKEEASGKG